MKSNKKIKIKDPSQEDGGERPQDLEIYSSNFSTKPKNSFELFF
jgi:hypothetical protein